MDACTPGPRDFPANRIGPDTFYTQTSRGNAGYFNSNTASVPSLKRSYDSTDNIQRSCLKTSCAPPEEGRHESGWDMNPIATPRKSVRFDSGFIDGSMDGTELPEMNDCSTSSSHQSSVQLTGYAVRDPRHMSVNSYLSSTKDLHQSFEAYPTKKEDSLHNFESISKCSPEQLADTQRGVLSSFDSAPIKRIHSPVELITQGTSNDNTSRTFTSFQAPRHPSTAQFLSFPSVVSSQRAAQTPQEKPGSSVHQVWTSSDGKTSRTEQTPTGSGRAPDTAWAPFKQPHPPDSLVVAPRRPEAISVNQPKRELFKPSPGAIRSVSQVCSQLFCPLTILSRYQKEKF